MLPHSSDYALALRPNRKLKVYGPTIWSNVLLSESAVGIDEAMKIAMVTINE